MVQDKSKILDTSSDSVSIWKKICYDNMQNILQGLCPYKIYYSINYDKLEREREESVGWERLITQ